MVEALHQKLDNDHHPMGYKAAKRALFGVNEDGIEVHDGKIECAYTGRVVRWNNTSNPEGFNTEHTWPQSRGTEHWPASADLHHLFPTDATANNVRANHFFGDTTCSEELDGCSWQQGGSELGNENGRDVFEVRPERRGNSARAVFYMSVRYGLTIDGIEEAVLRRWHRDDPPDEAELDRNRAVEAHQGNRNPFVDRPDFVQRIGDF
jgi:endonuclease I